MAQPAFYKSQLEDLAQFREGYFKYHKSRIEKKKPENRTTEENELLEELVEQANIKE